MGLFSSSSKAKQYYDGIGKPKAKLGSGNFATVYRCTKKDVTRKFDEKDAKAAAVWEDKAVTDVAIKVIDKNKVEDMNDVKREIEIMEKLDHPNIVKLYELFHDDKASKNGKIYLVMQLVNGGELFDAIVADEKFTEQKAARIMKELCGALAYMHEQKVVHRDLKPENILLQSKQPDSPIMVADFGLARVVSKKEMMKTACGTPGYVAPEILKNKGYDDSACDIWSAGVILYIMLCGFPPFYEEELPALFDSIMSANYDYPSPWWDSISKEGKALVSAILTVDPKKRITATGILGHTCAAAAAAAYRSPVACSPRRPACRLPPACSPATRRPPATGLAGRCLARILPPRPGGR